MTDNEIIKALECCTDCNCKECPCCRIIDGGIHCTEIDEEEILDLINRQKEEIEELRKGFTADADYFSSEYDKNIKAEAIKEFAENAKMECYATYDEVLPSLFADIIDNLVKEMTEVNENDKM